jgi:hypothetical protein
VAAYVNDPTKSLVDNLMGNFDSLSMPPGSVMDRFGAYTSGTAGTSVSDRQYAQLIANGKSGSMADMRIASQQVNFPSVDDLA